MPKVTTLQSNFTAGEFSPKLYGRVDIDRYPNAVKRARNGYSFVHGGFRWRMGTRYVAEIKNSSATARLIPYIISQDEAYVVELGEGTASLSSTLRFYTGAGRVEVAGVPVEANLASKHSRPFRTKYAMDDGLLYLTNGTAASFSTVALETVERVSTTSFAAGLAQISVPPTTEGVEMASTTLTLAALTGAFLVTAAAATFQNADVGRYLRAGVGYAKITGFTSTTQVTIDTTALGGRDFSVLNYAIGEWFVDGSPQATLTPSATGPLAASITLTLAANGWKNNAQFSHIGKYVEVNGGLCEITAIASAVSATGRVWALLSSTTAAGAGSWVLRARIGAGLNVQLFNAISFHEQRMVLANSISEAHATYGLREWIEPQTIFLGVSGLPEFSVGSSDDDALELLAKSETVTSIEHLVSFGDLIAFTNTTVFRIYGGVEKPITPSNFQIKAQSEVGSNYVRPIKIGSELIYAEASGKRVHAFAYDPMSDRYHAGDISTLAEHILAVGVVDMAFAQRPDPLLFCVLADGTLAICALDRSQNVVGWSLCETDGVFESVAVIPYNNDSQVSFIIRRTIGGVTKRYVERLEDGLETDCCVTGSAGVATTVWSGFGHLEGKTLDVIANGSYVGQKTVTGGNITLDVGALTIEAGLHYDAELEMLAIELAGPQGSIQGDAISVHQFIMRVSNSVGCLVRNKPIVFTRPTVNDAPPPTFSGDFPIGVTGWGNDSILIQRDKPYAFTLLAAMRKFTTNPG